MRNGWQAKLWLWGLGLVALGSLLEASVCLAEPNGTRPNFLVILADDLGFSDLGCFGGEIATPEIDRLAEGGVRFTQFYNCGRCCPTRASLLTGLYPHQAGVGHMLGDWGHPGYRNGLAPDCATIAEVLSLAGYRNYHVGKWHTGGFAPGQEQNHPLARGFDRFYGTAGGGDYFAPEQLMRDRETIEPQGDYYITDDFTAAAVGFLRDHQRQRSEQPFFLHLCYTAPHFPVQARAADINAYRGKYRDGWDVLRQRRYDRLLALKIVYPLWRLSARDPIATPWDDTPDHAEGDLRMAAHAASVTAMDRGVGQVLNELKQSGQFDNTLVLFLSDNGASAEFLDNGPGKRRGHNPGAETGSPGSHRCLEVGWANACNTPFREHKMWMHEGGISTPLVAHWPRGIENPNRNAADVGHVMDLMPTLLELAGVSYPRELSGRHLQPLAGRSFAAVLRGETLPQDRTLGFEHEGNRALRRGDMKVVATYQGAWELYDLDRDRTETHDLAETQRDQVQELVSLWEAWAREVGVVAWEKLPGARYQPTPQYRKKSEPVAP
jgi:arylsulfatase